LLAAGSLSKTDVAQLESQYSTDKYQLVAAQTTLEETKLQLKQLLELDINEEMNLSFPELSDEEVMQVLPAKAEIYQIALQSLPEIKSMDLSIQSAKIGVNKQKQVFFQPLASMRHWEPEQHLPAATPFLLRLTITLIKVWDCLSIFRYLTNAQLPLL